jgi:hypothetical protein
MECMVRRGVVNLENPEGSLVLDWIDRGRPTDPSTLSPAHAEYVAFSEWIEYSQQCHQANCGSVPNPCGPPPEEVVCSDDVPEDCGITREELVENRDILREATPDCTERDMARAFHLLVTPWRNRCSHCHSPSGSFADIGETPATAWMDDGMLYDADEDASLRTMKNAIEMGIINPDNPGQSLLLTKPLWESQGGVEHGGGDKFSGPTDETFRNFLVWLVMYSNCAPLPPDDTLVK